MYLNNSNKYGLPSTTKKNLLFMLTELSPARKLVLIKGVPLITSSEPICCLPLDKPIPCPPKGALTKENPPPRPKLC